MIKIDGQKIQRVGLIGTITNIAIYTGDYSVTPKVAEDTVLKTKGRKMTKNVVVEGIPVREIRNQQGGITLLIGDDK